MLGLCDYDGSNDPVPAHVQTNNRNVSWHQISIVSTFIYWPFPHERGAGVGETVGTMTTVGWSWQEQGGYSLVDHVVDYRMVGFGRVLTQCEGAGVDTVLLWLLVNFHRKNRLNGVDLDSDIWGTFWWFSHLSTLELQRDHFSEVEVDSTQLVRVDDCFHRILGIISIRWRVPFLKRETRDILIHTMQSHS